MVASPNNTAIHRPNAHYNDPERDRDRDRDRERDKERKESERAGGWVRKLTYYRHNMHIRMCTGIQTHTQRFVIYLCLNGVCQN